MKNYSYNSEFFSCCGIFFCPRTMHAKKHSMKSSRTCIEIINLCSTSCSSVIIVPFLLIKLATITKRLSCACTIENVTDNERRREMKKREMVKQRDSSDNHRTVQRDIHETGRPSCDVIAIDT